MGRRKFKVATGSKRAPDVFVSYAVEEFNRSEREREQENLRAKCYGAANLPPRELLLESATPIFGWRNWFVISAFIVQLSRHTQMGKSMTKIVMERLGIREEKYVA